MKHPINQLTAYIEVETSASREDLRAIAYEHMKYVKWSDCR